MTKPTGGAWALAIASVLGACSQEPSGADEPPSASDTPRTLAPTDPPSPENAPIAVNANPPASDPPRVGTTPSVAALAREVVISELALYQGTRVALARNGQPLSARAMPVVAGRDALLRVFVTPKAGAAAKTLEAELYLGRAGKLTHTQKTSVTVRSKSTEADPGSTFNLTVPGTAIESDTELVVRLIEPGAPAVPTSTTNAAQYPVNGTTARLEAKPAGTLKVVLVPVLYGADGSNRTPDLSQAVLDATKKRLLELYPVAAVDLRVRQPVAWSQPILANGTGWDEVLDKITQLRLIDNTAFDVYYYGAFAPAPTLDAYCPGSCMLGLSNLVTHIGDAAFRASAGVLYSSTEAVDTVPHELGHAHGRDHAPCGNATDVDPGYPYAGGRSGSWGYSIVTRQLQPPTLYDQMSYCTPVWQSDYTYRALFDRVHTLATMRVSPAERAPQRYRMLRVRPDGSLRWAGDPFETSVPVESSHAQPVAFLDAKGRIVHEAIAHGTTYDHQRGGVFIVPWSTSARFERVQLRATGESMHPTLASVRDRLRDPAIAR